MGTKIYDAELQFLTIAYATKVGLDDRGRVAAFDRDLRGRKESGLLPLLIYSVVAPCYSVFARQLVDPRDPLPISTFLSGAWCGPDGLGIPLSLEIRPQLLTADRGFAAWIAAQGVHLRPAPSNTSLVAFERSAQDVWFATQWRLDNEYSKPRKLDRANDAMRHYDLFTVPHHKLNSFARKTFEAWYRRERRFTHIGDYGGDWNVSVVTEREIPRPEPALVIDPAVETTAVHVEGLKEVVAMWPGGRGAFLREVGIRARDFNFWVNLRANLDPADFQHLRERLALEFDDDIAEFELGGGYLLNATTLRDVKAAYTVLSRGGDLLYAFELLGPSGEMARMRFLVFESQRGPANIILFGRGTPVERALNSRTLINLENPIQVPPEVWETVNYIIEGRDDFQRPEEIGKAFAAKHREWREQFEERDRFGGNWRR